MPSNTRGIAERLLIAAIVLAALPLNALFGLLTTYVLAVLALLAAALLLWNRLPWRAGTDTKILLAVFVTLGVLFALTAQKPTDTLSVVNFAAFVAYAPLGALLWRGAAPENARRVAMLALVGAALPALIATIQAIGLGQERAIGLASDPIRFADNAVICGFLALLGCLDARDRWRWVYLAGPVFALVVILFTGTRIAMVAFPIVGAVALLTAVPARARLPLLALLVVVVVATGFAVMNSGHARFVSLIETVNQLAAGIPVTDNSVRIRIELYDGAWRAFLQSPLIGHGWRHMMPSVIALIPEADRAYVSGLPHLHNDVLNFMVFGGLVGLALYVTLLALPLVLALRSPADSQKRQRVMGVIVLVASYISMGLTDTMLSFELHTMLYVALTAILLRFCRDGEAAA